MEITWVLEREMFRDNHDRLANAVNENNMKVVNWSDDWCVDESYPTLKDQTVVFHGSLGNASLISQKKMWNPGAFCNTENFKCSSWYSKTSQWLFQSDYSFSNVEDFVNNPEKYLKKIGDTFFVRPNSPLKSFSGRVLSKENLSMEALDYGFYYDDPKEEIVISSLQEVSEEWRYVVCNKKVIAGSYYFADNRIEGDKDWNGKPLELAQEIASSIEAPDDIYVLDICRTGDEFKLMELNPFSGADLYNCDRDVIVKEIAKFLNGEN